MIARYILLMLCFSFVGRGFSQTPDQAIDSLKKVIATTGSDSIYITTCNELAYSLMETDPRQALKVVKKGNKRALLTDSWYLKLITFNRLADVYTNLSQFELSIENGLKTLEFVPSSDPKKEKGFKGVIYNSIVLNYLKLANYEEVIKYGTRSAQMLKEAEQYQMLGAAYSNIGMGYMHLGLYAKSDSFYRTALEYKRQYNNSASLAYTLLAIASSQTLQSKPAKAIPLLKKAISQLAQSQNIPLLALTHANLGIAYDELKQEEESELHFRICIQFTEGKGFNHELQNCYLNFSEFYFRVQKYDSAYHYLFLSKTLSDSIYTFESQAEIAKLLEQYKSVEKDAELAQKTLEIEKSKSRTRLMAILAIIAFVIILGIILYLQARRRNKFDKELNASQLTAAKAQINPHFIANFVCSLQNLIHEDEDAAENYSNTLSVFLRSILNFSDRKLISLTEEVVFINQYLDLENISPQKNYILNINIDTKINHTTTQFPPMVLQPIIENAMKHKTDGAEDRGEIKISLQQEGKILKCTIANRGTLSEENMKELMQKGENPSGFRLARQVIRLLNKEARTQGELVIESHNNEIFTSFSIPYITK